MITVFLHFDCDSQQCCWEWGNGGAELGIGRHNMMCVKSDSEFNIDIQMYKSLYVSIERNREINL